MIGKIIEIEKSIVIQKLKGSNSWHIMVKCIYLTVRNSNLDDFMISGTIKKENQCVDSFLVINEIS